MDTVNYLNDEEEDENICQNHKIKSTTTTKVVVNLDEEINKIRTKKICYSSWL